MIRAIFGDNLKESRLFLRSLTEGKRPVVFTDENLDMTSLAQSFEGGLFGESEVFVFENLLSRTKSQEKSALLKFISSNSQGNEIIFWDSKIPTPATLRSLPNAETREFKHPLVLFQFLDSIKPGNSQKIIELHKKTLLSTEEEMVFFMLVRQFRLLLALAEDANIEETKRLAPWQKGKLDKQAKLIGEDMLRKHYKTLFRIDKEHKTGSLNAPLPSVIDFFLSSI